MRGFASSALARGIRWRMMGSVLVVITAAIAVGTAIVGPLFLRAGGDSLVRRAVADASASKTRLELTPVTRATTLDGLAGEKGSLLRSQNLTGLYGPSVSTMLSTILLTSKKDEVYAGRLTYRAGICSVLHFSAGGCRAGPREAVVSERSARELGVSVGSTITVNDLKDEHPVGIRITGVYHLPNLRSAYWFGDPGSYFSFGQETGKPRELDEVDDLFVARPAALALPPSYVRSITIQTGLRPGSLGIGNASAVRRELLTLKQRAAVAGFQLETGLPAVISGALHQQSLMNTIVVAAAVQLVLLAMWVLTSTLMRSADLRRSELRVARLRGFPFPTLLGVSITEPAALCAIGVVLGIVGAWGVVLLAASILFAPGTTVALDAWTFVGFGIVVLTICAVLGFSSVRLLRSFGLAASSPPSAGKPSRVVVDVAILAISVVALIGAATSGALTSRNDPVAAAAPAFVALGTAVIAIRIVEYLCRRLSAATLDSSSVALFLAVRQVGRRPTALREGRTLIIAVALACFAVSAWSVARANRLTAARFSIGAPTVATVTGDDRLLDRAVDAVDPRGRFAMTAVEIHGPGTPVIGVDAKRLAAVAAWPGGTTHESLAAVSRALTSGGKYSGLPAVAGSFAESLAAGSGQNGSLSVQGLDGYNVTVHPVVAASSVPRIGPGGVIVDLGALRRAQTGPTFPETSEEVWLGSQAPANTVSRLRAAGLEIDRVERSSTLVSQAAHTGPALAYDFMLLATIVALIVAAVGTFSVLAAGGRQRATELVALEVAGVRREILTHSLAIEAGILALTALFGVAAGAGSAAVVLPSLPQLAAPTEAPLSYALPVSLLLAVAAGAVLVVMAASALAARSILRKMSPTLLRNAADDVD